MQAKLSHFTKFGVYFFILALSVALIGTIGLWFRRHYHISISPVKTLLSCHRFHVQNIRKNVSININFLCSSLYSWSDDCLHFYNVFTGWMPHLGRPTKYHNIWSALEHLIFLDSFFSTAKIPKYNKTRLTFIYVKSKLTLPNGYSQHMLGHVSR